jgi:hypothetical protein
MREKPFEGDIESNKIAFESDIERNRTPFEKGKTFAQ